jgi:hypothetical protein
LIKNVILHMAMGIFLVMEGMAALGGGITRLYETWGFVQGNEKAPGVHAGGFFASRRGGVPLFFTLEYTNFTQCQWGLSTHLSYFLGV